MSEKASFKLRGRNPDVLTCIANLSNDEVFTPPEFANRMLDTLAEAWAADNGGANIWADKSVKFLDPFTKSGVFLREITKRLVEGLAEEIPDLQQRVDHILHNQVYGIATTKLTSLLARRSLYCSKYANGEHSVATGFENESGNVWFERMEHTWLGKKCSFCGAGLEGFNQGNELENHAYAFIHTEHVQARLAELFGEEMHFDVIVGNPPYQLADGGGTGRSARPIYNLFIDKALALSPRYVCMVIPARWYTSGKGLDDFRKRMLGERRLRHLSDFESATDVFAGVDIAGGVCYFVWNRDKPGKCIVEGTWEGQTYSEARDLDEFDVLVRQSRAVPIIRKVRKKNQRFMSEVVSQRQPFGLPSNYNPRPLGADTVPCWFTQRLGLQYAAISDVRECEPGILDKWKLLVPFAPIAGQTDFAKPVRFYSRTNTIIAEPGQACSESWLVAFSAISREEVEAFRSYLFTKTFRFLLLQSVMSQNITRSYFRFVPDLGRYEGDITDRQLVEAWGITEDEWSYMDARIADHE
ncbi:MAG: Eco57I restriction-modification methylase domain-containing protein [Fimbriimonadaceae bacterium]|nr:Eco57I restriction-modification methylase domain-containing protein [Fimbriimonadaceae bacterium]